MRASLETLKTEPVLEMNTLPFCWQPMSISIDERYFLYTTLLPKSPEQYNLVRVDLRDKSWKMFFDKPEPSRCGGSFNPVTGHNILIACSENAWAYVARRWYDPKAKRERLLPAEFLGPLPIAVPER